MTEDRMPERIWVNSDGLQYEGKGTEFVRNDVFRMATNIIEKFLMQGDFSDPHWLGNDARTFLSTHRPLTDRGNQ